MRILLPAALLLRPACRPAGEGSGVTARLSGAVQGEARGDSAAVSALRCDGARGWVEVRGVMGDTGIGLVLYPAPDRALAAGRLAVHRPGEADSLRPAAAVSVRWLDSTRLQGLVADSGTVTLERLDAGRVSARIRARLRSAAGDSTAVLTAAFRDVPLRAGPTVRDACGPDSLRAAPGDSARPTR